MTSTEKAWVISGKGLGFENQSQHSPHGKTQTKALQFAVCSLLFAFGISVGGNPNRVSPLLGYLSHGRVA